MQNQQTKRTLVHASIRGAVILFVLLPLWSHAQRQARPYYHEDLYGLRPKLNEPVDTISHSPERAPKQFVAAHYSVNEKVDDVLDSINSFNITRKFIDGYTIQVYSGQNREEANNIKKRVASETGLNAMVEYNQPKFRVRYGGYYSRMEAQRDLTRLKRSFANAILVPEKLLVR